MGVDIVKATAAHVAELVASMRPEDVEEMRELGHQNIGAALDDSLCNTTNCVAILVDGKVGAVLGWTPADGVTNLWAFTTSQSQVYPVKTQRLALHLLRTICDACGPVVAYTRAQPIRGYRWLRSLGFRKEGAVMLGPGPSQFLRMVRT